jgi:stearoyl-CoA desaturase (delta-9 desaturase)
MSAAPATVAPPPTTSEQVPDPDVGRTSGWALWTARLLTGLIVVGPAVALGVGIPFLWGTLISLRDVVIGVILYVVTGHGITVGYHRLFAHRGFTPNRAVKIVLAAFGSMAVEGSVIGWVAAHRRHHRFSDQPGDPHSPHGFGTGVRAQLRGLVHAQVGWLFAADTTSQTRYAPDLVADPDLVQMSRWWPSFAIGSLVLPFLLGWVLSGSLLGGLTTFLWAGLVRMMLLHHVTWSINSICHAMGPRPFRTRDQSRNVAALSVLSMGESFHNLHHAYPQSARHGVLDGQVDSSAGVIRVLEQLGWVTGVRWPDPVRVRALRVDAGPDATTAPRRVPRRRASGGA